LLKLDKDDVEKITPPVQTSQPSQSRKPLWKQP
jgi:hypothetical protein